MRLLAMAMILTMPLALQAHAAAPADCPAQLIENPALDPKTGKETPAARDARLELEMVVNVQVMYEGCSLGNPGFVARFAPSYQAWRARYREAIARYERNARAKRYVECGLDFEKKRAVADTSAGRAEKAQICVQMMGPGIERFTQDGYPK